MSIERSSYIESYTGDVFVRSGKRWNRAPVGELKDEIQVEIDDREVNTILYELSDLSLLQRGFRPELVTQWTIDIANGNIPSGFYSVEEFINIVKNIRHFRYNLTK